MCIRDRIEGYSQSLVQVGDHLGRELPPSVTSDIHRQPERTQHLQELPRYTDGIFGLRRVREQEPAGYMYHHHQVPVLHARNVLHVLQVHLEHLHARGNRAGIIATRWLHARFLRLHPQERT